MKHAAVKARRDESDEGSTTMNNNDNKKSQTFLESRGQRQPVHRVGIKKSVSNGASQRPCVSGS